MTGAGQPLRSILFVPADVPRYVNRAPGVGANAIVLDLEDAVRPTARAAARETIRESIAMIRQAGCPVYVRVNREVRELVADLDAVVTPDLKGIVLPKADTPGLVHIADELVSQLETDRCLPAGAVEFHLLIESALGLERVTDVLTASPRVTAAALGAGDFAFSGGLDPNGFAVQSGALRVFNAARAHGKRPLGLAGVVHDFSDLGWYRRLVQLSKEMGSTGSYCIHPSQVEILNAVFAPPEAEINWAVSVVNAFADERRSASGAFMHNSEFLDMAMLRRAQAVLASVTPERLDQPTQ